MGFKTFVQRKYSEAKTGIKKDMAYRKEVRMAANEAAMVERKKQSIATAVAREQQRGKAARTPSGGSFSSGMSFLSGVGGSTRQSSAPMTRKKVTTYVKKGKGYVKRTSYKPVRQVANRQAISNNQEQFSGMFGSSNYNRDKKKSSIPNLRL